ncbi:MAG: hypothetical protein R3C46_16395 [Hyphomonadaceae bacterium]
MVRHGWVAPARTMFKKSDNKARDPLADRMRKISAAPVEETDYSSVATGEKRAERKPTFKSATLTMISGERVDVVVKNISETGARIEFVRDVTLSDRVLLSEPTMRIRTWAYVIWQTRGAAGLQFVAT